MSKTIRHTPPPRKPAPKAGKEGGVPFQTGSKVFKVTGRPPVWPKALALKKQRKSLLLGPYSNPVCARVRANQFNNALKARLPDDAKKFRFVADGRRVKVEAVKAA